MDQLPAPHNQIWQRMHAAVRSVCRFFLCGTSRNEPHTEGRCAKWVASGKEHQETIKFGGFEREQGEPVWFGLHWN